MKRRFVKKIINTILEHKSIKFLKTAFVYWYKDDCFQMAAALSYYAVLFLVPLAIIGISSLDMILNIEFVQDQILNSASKAMNKEAADVLFEMVYQLRNLQINPIVPLIVLLFGATKAFSELRRNFNKIFRVPKGPKKKAEEELKMRLSQILILILLVFLLMATTVLGSLLSFISNYMFKSVFVVSTINTIIGILLIAVFFVAIYKVFHDLKVTWKEALIGGLLTSTLFFIGRAIISQILLNSKILPLYNAASAISFLVWIFYASHVLFFGAELTKTYIFMNRKLR